MAALLAIAAASGCRRSATHPQSFFPAADQVRDVDRAMAAQTSAGAAQDAMLTRQHFDGGELNALGRAKLHLMLAQRPAQAPLIVYLNLDPGDELTRDRAGAVSSHLAGAGLSGAHIKVQLGPNPNCVHPANPEDLRVLESAATGNQSSASSRTIGINR